MNTDALIGFIMDFGPDLLKIGLLGMAIFHAWQRNIVKAAISAGACICTFILGW